MRSCVGETARRGARAPLWRSNQSISRGSHRLKALDFDLNDRAVEDSRWSRAARHARQKWLEPLETLLVEPSQLDQRLVMVIDPKVERRIILGRAQQECRRLFTALVAARSLAGGEGGDEPLGKGPPLLSHIGCRGLLDDARTRKHVSRDREPLADDVAGPIDAGRARMGGRSSLRAHQMDLPLVTSRVGP